MPAFRRYVILIKVVAGLTTTARCRPIKPTKIKVHFEGGWTWLNNKERSSRHMRTSAVPNNVTHITPTSSPFFLYPAFSLFFSWIELGACWFPCSSNCALLLLHRNKTATTVQKSVTHFGRIFPGIEKGKRAFERNSNFPADFIWQISHWIVWACWEVPSKSSWTC